MQPHLEAAGAASSVASTCKQLQRLCQGSVTELWLPAKDLAELQTIARVERDFTACESLGFTLKYKDDAAFYMPDALNMLTR
jgi:hypothetical protein